MTSSKDQPPRAQSSKTPPPRAQSSKVQPPKIQPPGKIYMLPIIIFLSLVSCGVLGWYYYQQQKTSDQQRQQFITEAVQRGSIAYTVNASGMVYPKRTVEVGAQVSGEISDLLVSIGDTVKKGDIIAEIAASTKENAKLSAQAQLKSQQAALSNAKNTLRRAQSDYTRTQTLYQEGAATRQEYENAQTALSTAQNSITEAQEKIVQSQLTIKDAEIALGYTMVTAPIDGTVIAVVVEEGQTVNAQQSTPTLITLAQTDVMTVKAEIAEADIAVMKTGLPVSFSLLGKNSDSYEGTLNQIDPAPTDISDNKGLTNNTAIYYYGHINVKNTKNKLRYGMTATISIEVDKVEDVLMVPVTAINNTRRGSVVRVLKDGRPTPQPIRVGLEDGIHAQVLSGLSEGDEVIISSGNNRPSNRSGGRGGGRGGRGGPPGGLF